MRIFKLLGTLILLTLITVTAFSASPQDRSPNPGTETHSHSNTAIDGLAAIHSRPDWAPLPLMRGDLKGLRFLKSAVRTNDAKVRARCAFMLGQIDSPGCVPILRRLVKDRDSSVRQQAGISLACIRRAEGLPQCKSAIDGSSPEWIQYYAIYGLWNIHSPAALRSLRNAKIGDAPLLKAAVHGALTTPQVSSEQSITKAGESTDDPKALFWQNRRDLFESEADWWFHKGNYEQLIRSEMVVLFLDPKDMETSDTIAYYQWSLGREDQAVETWKSAITTDPKNPNAYFYLGQHYSIIKKYTLAENPLQKSVELGGDALAHRTYAHCLEHIGKLPAALQQWDYLVRLDPRDGAAIVNRDRVKASISGGK